MHLLPDADLYSNTEHCLAYLRQLGPQAAGARTGPERFHFYWYGAFGPKQAFAVKSFLATQDLERGGLVLWLDAENGYADNEQSDFLRPFRPYVEVRCFDPVAETRGTPLEGRRELYETTLAQRSDLARFVVLYKHGGVYLDTDIMLLRDLQALDSVVDARREFCYRWSGTQPYANSAVLRLSAEGAVAAALLECCAALGTCLPQQILRFERLEGLDLVVLPCVLFDPLWPHRDGRDRYHRAPFDHFPSFFSRIRRRRQERLGIRSGMDFFPGAFAYHWHGEWHRRAHPKSYFRMFDRELDGALRSRYGIEPWREGRVRTARRIANDRVAARRRAG